MSKFYVPKRYDVEAATEGKWFEIEDQNGNHYGEFKLRLIDSASQRMEREANKVKLKYRSKSKNMNEFESLMVVICELALVDWKLPLDPSDKKAEAVPYTIENAMEYFNLNDDTRWVLMELAKLADNITYFAPDVAEAAEEAEKN